MTARGKPWIGEASPGTRRTLAADVANWDWRMDSEIAGISALVAADAAAYLSAFNPSIFTIRSFANSWGGNETKGDIRRGVALGAVLTLITGLGGSAVTRSYWPLLAAVVTLGFIAVTYEWALANPRGGGSDSSA